VASEHEKMNLKTPLTEATGIELPIICGAMYPCSNPELVAAASAAGGIGVIQPLTLVYVYKYDFRTGLARIRELTDRPVGFNVLLETSSKVYEKRMREWLEIALENGVRFFVTALGNPRWVVDLVHAHGGVVYHDVVSKKWALKALDAGVDGLICVNRNAGGHAGSETPEKMIEELGPLGKPLVCAGGIGDASDFTYALKLGFAGVQMGTRFIATRECKAPQEYKEALVRANASDIVLTERVTGIPLAVINTPYVQSIGTRAGPLARFLLQNRRTKKHMRTLFQIASFWKLKRSMQKGMSTQDYWQAGRSVASVQKIESVAEILARFRAESVRS
jgi:nitronate monooxygenase